MEIEIEKDIISLTTKTVEFLLTKNPDALTLYLLYHKNAKIQKTNQIWTTDTFGMRGLGWGKKRYTDAKNILIESGLVEITQPRLENGRLGKIFVKLKYIHRKDQKPLAVETAGGNQETNALSNKTEMLKVIKDLSTDVPSEPTQDAGVPLPDKYGKTPYQRLEYVYRKLWLSKFGVAQTAFSFAKFAKIMKGLLVYHNEYQIAVLLLTFFNWYGASGNDEREYLYLSNKGFPIEFLPNKVDIMVAHLTNVHRLVYNSEKEIKSFAVKHLGKLLA